MATKPLALTMNHTEWATAVHAAFERERVRLARIAAENRLTAARRHWWTTPTELAEGAGGYARRCAAA
jgi:hypothetical protein